MCFGKAAFTAARASDDWRRLKLTFIENPLKVPRSLTESPRYLSLRINFSSTSESQHIYVREIARAASQKHLEHLRQPDGPRKHFETKQKTIPTEFYCLVCMDLDGKASLEFGLPTQ